MVGACPTIPREALRGRETSAQKRKKPEPRSRREAGLGRMRYGQRLREFNLYGLERQRWRGNRITLYKYLKGTCVRKGKESDACSSRGRDVLVRSWNSFPREQRAVQPGGQHGGCQGLPGAPGLQQEAAAWHEQLVALTQL